MCCFSCRDGPSLQKLSKFVTTDASSAGPNTRQTYKLIHGHGLSPNERAKPVQSLCVALKTQFEDTTQGMVQATAIADFKMWPFQEAELKGYDNDWITTLLDQLKTYMQDVDQPKLSGHFFKVQYLMCMFNKCLILFFYI